MSSKAIRVWDNQHDHLEQHLDWDSGFDNGVVSRKGVSQEMSFCPGVFFLSLRSFFFQGVK